MKLVKGKDRFVILFPEWGFVIKLPIVHLKTFFRVLMHILKRKDWKSLRMYMKYGIDVHFSFRKMLFAGICANWMEFWFFITTRNPFIQPTLFSFFGLFNIQYYGSPTHKSNQDLLKNAKRITQDEAGNDIHHFQNSGNYSIRNGRLRMHDYGSRDTRDILRKWGRALYLQMNS